MQDYFVADPVYNDNFVVAFVWEGHFFFASLLLLNSMMTTSGSGATQLKNWVYLHYKKQLPHYGSLCMGHQRMLLMNMFGLRIVQQ